MADYIKRMNWQLLRSQKQLIVGLTNGATVSPEQSEAIEGILALIDAIQDSAVDTLGMPECNVFGHNFDGDNGCTREGCYEVG